MGDRFREWPMMTQVDRFRDGQWELPVERQVDPAGQTRLESD